MEHDERGERRGLRARRVVVGLLTLVPLVALTGAIGQRAATPSAAGPQATIFVRAPKTVRGGLFFRSRVTITVKGRIQHPRLVLDPGWLEGMQMNSIEPGTRSESSRDGRVVPARAGRPRRAVAAVPGQPHQRRPPLIYALELDDGTTRIARVDRPITVLP